MHPEDSGASRIYHELPHARSQQAHGLLTQLRAVLGWKVIEYAGLAAFMVIAPRAMGPESYGAFAAVLSLTMLLANAARQLAASFRD